MRSGILLLLSLVFVLGCTFAMGCTTPAERLDRRAAEQGFTRHEVAGVGFVHALYQRGALADAARLHIYIAGDGTPRDAARYDPPDPTPTADPTFELMSLDPAPSILLGRPCQHITGACDPLHFTLGRYGEPVVASMAVALRSFLVEQQARDSIELVLIGYSGGGTLATLLAARLPEAIALVTLGANLDTAAWVARHGYEPLIYSLNPAERPPLRESLVQLHLRGGLDTNVALGNARRWIDAQPDAHLRTFERFDHGCCWTQIWPEVLREVGATNHAAPVRN